MLFEKFPPFINLSDMLRKGKGRKVENAIEKEEKTGRPEENNFLLFFRDLIGQ